jgi:hypothetical protein
LGQQHYIFIMEVIIRAKTMVKEVSFSLYSLSRYKKYDNIIKLLQNKYRKL